MQTKKIFLVNYLDLGNKLFKIFINFVPFPERVLQINPLPKVDLMLRILDTRGYPLLPLWFGSHPYEYLFLQSEKHSLSENIFQLRDKCREKVRAFEQREKLRPSDRAIQSNRMKMIPFPSSSPLILRHRNYI